RNLNQIAVLKTETLAEGDCNRYRVWYEPECRNYFVYLLLCLSIMDYIFCTDNSSSGGRNQYHVYLKKSQAEEISWRPSDYTEIQQEEDKKYFEKAGKDESKMRILFIVFMVVWVCLWVIFFLHEYM
ncbi:MAG: hypothetical protein LUD81_09775, partial [Clostridiales bacterium]|nr:hypothetical protein [Clostridiales bacterium]